MELFVTEEDVIRNIQHGFSEVYPHLELRFYRCSHEKGKPLPESARLPASQPIEEITMFHTSASINIDPERTVAAVEKDFLHKLGLHVQVYRQSGSLWLETVDTDHWTLKRQEQTAKESMMPPGKDEIADFDLSEMN